MYSDFIISMHRTGHHAVAIWLLHQKPEISSFSINTIADWLFVVAHGGTHILANNGLKVHENKDREHLLSICEDVNADSLIVTHEQETIKDSIEDAGKTFLSLDKPIVVIRDFRNWVASCIRMALRDDKIIEHVIDSESIRKYRDHIINYTEKEYYYILYNLWATSKDYRRQICNDLGRVFTDAAKDQLSIFGGGSSFSGMKHLKTASAMDVNNRYKEMESHPYYEMMLSKYEDVLKISDTIFK